jgi:hypothetical protein
LRVIADNGRGDSFLAAEDERDRENDEPHGEGNASASMRKYWSLNRPGISGGLLS